MSDKQFVFSVVVPVHNVGPYLDETLESVRAQTIGFERSIQLILVNDGSTDDSEAVCLRWQDRYPDNVVYLSQENSGVSAARNAGMARVSGRYVNFLDADDLWDTDAFEKAQRFFENNPDVDVVAVRFKFFGASSGEHPLDYKFEQGERVVDIAEEFDHVQLSAATTFLRAEAIAGSTFEPRLKYAEDFRYLTPLILKRGRYGVLDSTTYWYRRREDSDSAMNRSLESLSWYFDTPQLCHAALIEISKREMGCVHPYVQYGVMYDLKWRLRSPLGDLLDEEQQVAYRSLIAGLLRAIDDAVILKVKNLPVEYKIYALALKHGKTVDEMRDSFTLLRDGRVRHGSLTIRNLKTQEPRLNVEIMERRAGGLRLEGHINCIFSQANVTLTLKSNMGTVGATFVERPERDTFSLGERIHSRIGFVASLPLGDSLKVTPRLEFCGQAYSPELVFGKLVRLNHYWPGSYHFDGRYIYWRKDRSIKAVKESRRSRLLRWELKFLVDAMRRRRLFRTLRLRLPHFIVKPFFSGKRLWLMSDRIDSAGDNGEALFRYAMSHPDPGIRPYFVVSKSSPDFRRMREFGPVLAHGSLRHRLAYVLADKVISSAGEYDTVVVLDGVRDFVNDLCRFDFVFLQHGVTKDDISGWLNRYNKNIRLFVTAGRAEYDSIVNGTYYYTEREVRLTGFPRFDVLRAGDVEPMRQVLIVPTWRKALAGPLDTSTGLRARKPEFAESDYFRFYDSLINDPVLLGQLRASGYTCRFVLHPSFAQEVDLFRSNDVVTVHPYCDYPTEFKRSRLMVTDYSSVAFDFAYLGKPVIYAQFDRDAFAAEHTYKPGYFDYERDGFGPVCLDYESTRTAIVASLKSDTSLEEPYRGRAEAFFYRPETSHCEAVYREILALDADSTP